MVSVNSDALRGGVDQAIDRTNMNSFAGYRDTLTGADNFDNEMQEPTADDI